MASCYGSISAQSGGAGQGLRYLPIRTKLPDGTPVEIDYFRQSEHAAGHRLLNGVIEEGLSWPFEETMDMDAFRAYFLSHAAFVVRTIPPPPPAGPPAAVARVATPSRGEGSACTTADESSEGRDREGEATTKTACRNVGGRCSSGGRPQDTPGAAGYSSKAAVRLSEGTACSERSVGSSDRAEGSSLEVPDAAAAAAARAAAARGETEGGGMKAAKKDEKSTPVDVWGAFYIKPNFPGRCSHVCNGGFITEPRRRRRGVATLMGHAFLRFAKDLGYRASYFNLVFRSNEASLRLWRGLGFTELAVVPKAARLKGIDGLVDAIQFHYDLDTLRQEDLPQDLRESIGTLSLRGR